MNRRPFLRRTASWLGTALLRVAGYASFIESRKIHLERVTVRIPGLPPHLDGFTIGNLTDMHLGPFLTPEHGRRITDLLAAEKPDLTVLTGDLIAHPDGLDSLGSVLAPLSNPYGVLGNWDYELQDRLKEHQQIRVLINEGVLVHEDLWLAGVDDGLLGEPDINKALIGAPEGAIRILLAHEPDLVRMVKPEHQIALQLSGHSHGGQIRLPLIGPLLLPPLGRKYHTGLYQAPHCQVYTSRGIGMAHLPIRLNCPPEISLITLRRSDS